MLQVLREKAKGIVAWFVVVAIVASFAFFGIADYLPIGGGRTAASVNGEKISWATVEKISQRLSQQYSGQIDQKTLTKQIVAALVQRQALTQSAKASGFRVGAEQAEKLLLKIPAFQENGQFSKEQYLKALEQASYTDIEFRKQLQQDILVGQWEQGLLLSSFATPDELQQAAALFHQKRDFGYMVIPVAQRQKEITISGEQVKSYYEGHKSNFVQPEQVELEYVQLSLETIAKAIKPSENEVLAYYKEHQAAYSAPERVHARHILIAAPKNDAEQDKKAKQKIDALADKLKAGSDFSKLAQESSEDRGTAEKGGDLGWFMRAQMVPEFEQAAFALKKPGSFSDPVRTQFGYHIIQLIEHKDAEARPFNEVQNLVTEQLKREKAQAQFAETAELMGKLAFEQAGSLQPMVERCGLKVEVTEPFSREGGKGIAATPEVIKAAFSQRILKEGHNSEPLKLSDSAVAVVRLKQHSPAMQKTLEQVETEIRDRLVSERASIEVKEMGEKFVKDIQQGAKLADIAKQMQLECITKTDVTRASVEGLDPSIATSAFEVASDEQQHVKGFVLPNHDYLIVDVTKVKFGDWSNIDRETQKLYKKSLADIASQFEYALYVNQVQAEAKVSNFKEPASS